MFMFQNLVYLHTNQEIIFKMAITLPNLDPNIFSLGPIAIRWYSLAYIAGILLCLYFIKKQNNKFFILSDEALDNWLLYAVFGILIGGRLGYVLFYNFEYYIQNPIKIFYIWNGGMSFHGGLFGSILSMYLFSKKYKIEFLALMDAISIVAPIGLFFGRIANFINMELYGRVTNSSLGVIFPNSDGLPRHPSQLYEAFLEGLVLFIIMISIYRFTKASNKRGIICGYFLLFYSIFRFIIEFFREPDMQLGEFDLIIKFTMGQILTLPTLILAIILFFRAKNNNKIG